MAALKRRTKARKTVGQCKKCWDHAKIKAIHPIDYIKNSHIPKQNKPPTSKDRKQKIPHDVIVLKPSQWLPFVHYYPVKDGKVITKPNRSFKKQTTLFSKQSSTSGEKSGGSKELAAGYKKVFIKFLIFVAIATRLKSVVFDNEYFEKRVVAEIKRQYGLENKELFCAFRDHNHNINLLWMKVYDESLFAQVVIVNVRSIVNPLRHGAVLMIEAKNAMGIAALSSLH
eukprot:296274_1